MTAKDLCRKLEQNGWVLDRVKGSHRQYTKLGHVFTVPFHSGDLKKGLVRAALKKIEEVG